MQTRTLLLASPSLAALVAGMTALPRRSGPYVPRTPMEDLVAHSPAVGEPGHRPPEFPARPRYYVSTDNGTHWVMDRTKDEPMVRSYTRRSNAQKAADRLNANA